jgi:hypothetical protein
MEIRVYAGQIVPPDKTKSMSLRWPQLLGEIEKEGLNTRREGA